MIKIEDKFRKHLSIMSLPLPHTFYRFCSVPFDRFVHGLRGRFVPGGDKLPLERTGLGVVLARKELLRFGALVDELLRRSALAITPSKQLLFKGGLGKASVGLGIGWTRSFRG